MHLHIDAWKLSVQALVVLHSLSLCADHCVLVLQYPGDTQSKKDTGTHQVNDTHDGERLTLASLEKDERFPGDALEKVS